MGSKGRSLRSSGSSIAGEWAFLDSAQRRRLTRFEITDLGREKLAKRGYFMSEFNVSRRRVLEILTVGGLTVTIILPAKWIKPVVESVIVSAHAAASPVRTPLRGTTS